MYTRSSAQWRLGLHTCTQHCVRAFACAVCVLCSTNTQAQTTRPATDRPATQPAGDFVLRGRVLDDADEPLEGATVRNWQSNSETETDADGRFSFEGVPVVQSSVWVSYDGFVGESRQYVMPPDGRYAEMIIKLRRLGGISGIVVGPDGQTPIAEAAISTDGTRKAKEETGADGRFELSDLNPGTLNLLVWSDEYTLHRHTVQVTAGKTTIDVKIVLAKHGGTLTGRVINPDIGDEPVAGAFLVAFPLDLNDHVPSKWELRRLTEQTLTTPGYTLHNYLWYSAKTNDEGVVTFEHVPESPYLVCLFPRTGPVIRKENIAVKDGETTPPVTIACGRRPPGYITGTILMPNGEPLPNARYQMRHEYKTGSNSGSSSYGDKTDADGRYYVALERSGRQTLSFEIEGYERATSSFSVDRVDVVPPEQDITLKPRSAIAAAPTKPATSEPTGSIAGQVFLPDGKTPAADVPVKPFTKNRPFPGGSHGTSIADQDRYEWRDTDKVKTDADGSFVIEGLLPGQYGVFADNGMVGHSSLGIRPELVLTLPTPSAEVEVKADQQTAGVRIVMLPAGTATGFVRDLNTNEPIPNATVSIYAQRSTGWFGKRPKQLPFTNAMSHAVTTDQEGRFWIWSLPPGSHVANAQVEGYENTEAKGITIQAGQQTTIPDLMLKPQPVYAGPATGAISGQVFLPDGKTPAAGAMIGPVATSRFPGAQARWNVNSKQWFLRLSETTVTAQDGAFALDNLPAGQYRVYVQPHPEQPTFIQEDRPVKKPIPELLHTRATFSAALEIKADEPIKGVKIVLSAAGAVTGQLSDANTGEPLPGHIWLTPIGFQRNDPNDPPDFHNFSVSTDKDGNFQMPGLVPGKYDINISAQGNHEPINKRGQVLKAGETLKLDLKLKPRGK